MFGLSTTTYTILGTCAALCIGLLWYRHEIIVTEDLKSQAKTNSVKRAVQEKKNAIRNVPPYDARTINRLQHGTYFNQ